MILLPFLVCFQWILLFGASLDYLWSFFKSKLAHAPFTDVHHVDLEGALCHAQLWSLICAVLMISSGEATSFSPGKQYPPPAPMLLWGSVKSIFYHPKRRMSLEPSKSPRLLQYPNPGRRKQAWKLIAPEVNCLLCPQAVHFRSNSFILSKD